ncbi:MAG TPA: hypothetical protein VMR95_02405 [Candidatus Binatia bacterium]|nr:hypothetical protein [Candidatus Binatia bacterium]
MTTSESPRILIATGRTCAGKSTLVGRLIADNGFRIFSGETTRLPRDGDLPGEFNYLTNDEFDALNPKDMLFSSQHGLLSRYTLLNSVVEAALADEHNRYTRPLAPISAEKLVKKFGATAVKVIYLPTPDPLELNRRATARGDDPISVQVRVNHEFDWDEITRQTRSIYIAQGHTPEELQAEALALMEL